MKRRLFALAWGMAGIVGNLALTIPYVRAANVPMSTTGWRCEYLVDP